MIEKISVSAGLEPRTATVIKALQALHDAPPLR